MSPTLKFFFVGATGYIGSSVLERFLDHPDASNFEFTALVRDPRKAEKFKQFGINATVGSFDDAQLVEDLTAAADVVVDAGNADDLGLTKSMLRGFKRGFQKTGKPSTFIHTSGTGVLVDDAAGLRTTDVIWNDADPDQIEQLPPTAPHRDVDLEILQADKEGYVRAYFVLPSTIYGMASGKFVDAGLANKHSVQVPALIKTSLDRGQAGMIGKGLNIWPNVHIDEAADFYIELFNAIKANPDAVGHGRGGFYILLNGEHTLYDVSKEIGRALVALGKATTEVPSTYTQEEVNKYFGGSNYLGTNSRGLANHSRSIGWKPKKTTQDFLASIGPEVEEIAKSKHL
ncbi:hypothetical protein AGABI1DRAFT_57587 [Agaricus bisporus var. burnettii JB137-S8]|uniref:NAD(P)-binding domain-containing protein n=1 Tax=Agaricus bisporus var. burnettii (strain JB137-S8 / ATCC MYA-4627 / FGSC 10392) TaxID=597362 RepID=K5XXV9_AGABU|nr:uncharacterized protein AGABI1DRAFT_57587 [Agaricus bisporus var. burnettii JB137-S8]EKM80125.1 hypothetical protein AGABI1DRAFT_57587 [Agaricus bisporus var. burnettii JB137-S8]